MTLAIGWIGSLNVRLDTFFECVVFLIVDIVFHYIFTHIAKRIPIVAGRLQMNIPIL